MQPDDLKEWLRARPDATKQQEAFWLVARAAGRSLPLLHTTNLPSVHVESLHGLFTLLACLRLLAVNHSPEMEDFLRASARMKHKYNGDGEDLASVVGNAQSAIFVGQSILKDPTDVRVFAASARALSEVGCEAAGGAALTSDVAFVEAGVWNKTDIPLWPEGTPTPLGKAWESFAVFNKIGFRLALLGRLV